MNDSPPLVPGGQDPTSVLTRTEVDAEISETAALSGSDGSEGVPYAGLRLGALIAALTALGVWNPWMLVVIMALVVMITLHEFGHYITAKRAGMKVTEFFLFFGPKVWSIKRGETEYGIKCIPLGAYVKIMGMSNLEEVAPADESRTYRQKPFGRRLSVAVAGSTMHFLLAFVLIFVALSISGQPAGSIDPAVQARAWTIASITQDTGAAEAGLEPGDKIVRMNGQDVATFEDLRTVTKPLKGKTVPVTYVRDGVRKTVDVTLAPFYSWYVQRIVAGSAIAEAGIETGDQIISIDGRETRTTQNLGAVLAEHEGTTVPIVYERDDVRNTVNAKVDSLILEGAEGYVGIGRGIPPDDRLGVVEGLVKTPVEFVDVLGQSLSGLGKFFSPSGVTNFAGQVGSARQDRQESRIESGASATSTKSSAKLYTHGADGPNTNRVLSIVGLVSIGSEVGKVNPSALILLFATVNIFIGVFNLVPLLPFDGGHVVIAIYEKIQERRLNRKRYFTDVAKLLPLTYVVVVGLAFLFMSSLYLDIANPLVSS